MADKRFEIWNKTIILSYKSDPDEVLLSGIGPQELLERELIGVFSSVKCPGRLILAAHDKAKQLSKEMNTVIGGFQSPVEKEMLEVFLRGPCPLVICPARGLEEMRIPLAWKRKIDAGELLILSPFTASIKRPNSLTVLKRNQLVAHLANKILIVHAEPGGKVEALMKEAIIAGKPVNRL